MSEFQHWAAQVERARALMPDYMFGGFQRYVLQGIPPGDFLSAVISNDLRRAVERGDDANQANLANWVKAFYNYAPSAAWGSAEKFKAWVAGGGVKGFEEGGAFE